MARVPATSAMSVPDDDAASPLHFDVSTGLKRVLGRELITNDEVAIFELVKNCFDAGASTAQIYFGEDQVIIADNGSGMSFDDIQNKWLFVAYSAKREGHDDEGDFRDRVAERSHYAGSKGIGRFSSDRLGNVLTLQTRNAQAALGPIEQLTIDWNKFEINDKEHFEHVPVDYETVQTFILPVELHEFQQNLTHGTVITITSLRRTWDRTTLLDLKASLAKLINPFGSDVDNFGIYLTAPAELAKDDVLQEQARQKQQPVLTRDIVNGRVGNFIFSELQEKTTFISLHTEGTELYTTLVDRGELIYKIRESNPYRHLVTADFKCHIYYLNHSAKLTFVKRVGLPSIQFGSVFLFRNGFRVYPIGEDGDDWFGFDRRKQQGYGRFLGSREIIGRVDVTARGDNFQEASSRNAGLVDSPAAKELKRAVMDHGLKRLEKYVVPVSWPDKLEADTDDLSRLLTDAGRARVSAAVANLVDNEDVELLDYSKTLVTLLNERSDNFESSLVSLRAIAEKSADKRFMVQLGRAEKRFEELKRSQAEATRVADQERTAAAEANERAEAAEARSQHEERRANFLEAVVDLDTATVLNLHHQVTIYAVDIAQQIENLLASSANAESLPRATVLAALEQIAFLDRKILAITRFATKATFKLDSEKIETDLSRFITEYISNIARTSGSARTHVDVENHHPGLHLRFNPIDVSIVVDNLISNAKRARASNITFTLGPLERKGLLLTVIDNGAGLAKGVDPNRMFEMGYSTTRGSGLGLYHVRQVLSSIGGSIEYDAEQSKHSGTTFLIKVLPGKQRQ